MRACVRACVWVRAGGWTGGCKRYVGAEATEDRGLHSRLPPKHELPPPSEGQRVADSTEVSISITFHLLLNITMEIAIFITNKKGTTHL